jgi:hypothetical protein
VLPTFRVLFCAALVAASGCRNEQVREYTVPKEQAPAVPPSQGMGMGMSASPEAQSAGEIPAWTLPASWQQRPGEGMRYATLVVEATNPPLEIRVTPLGLPAKDPLSNINRWRGQIGLEPVSPEQLPTVARSEKINGLDATLADMTGPATAGQPAPRMLAAILPGQESVWFFLMTGPADRVGKHAKAFDRFIHSVRLGAAPDVAAMPPDHPPVDGTPAMPSDHPPVDGVPSDHPPVSKPQGAPGTGAPSADMAWVLPQGWQQAASTNSFRVGTFQFAEGAQSGEVAITKFPGGAGGVLENINRWRGQLGLPPVNSLQEQPMQKVTVAGIESARIDLVAKDGEAGAHKRMIVITLPHDDITYFIKMTGPSSLLDKHTKDFDAFLKSVQFPGARS